MEKNINEKNFSVSIIIPVAQDFQYLKNAIEKCLELDYKDFEIIILPDESFKFTNAKVKVIPTGHTTPAKKRNIGVKNSKGEIIAFIDDDAYPQKDWIKNTVKYFKDDKIGIVGGPGLNPPEDTLAQKASGIIWGTFIGAGPIFYRNVIQPTKEVNDFPTCNFFIKKKLFQEIRGFVENYWRGEDTLLCRQVLKYGKKILYAKDVIVFHHRRAVFLKHLKQIWMCGLYRGFFAKKFPENSSNYYYFIPTIIAFGAPLLLITDFIFFKTFIPFWIFIIYVAIIALAHLKTIQVSLNLFFLVTFGTIFTHFAYGYSFFQGYLSKRLK